MTICKGAEPMRTTFIVAVLFAVLSASLAGAQERKVRRPRYIAVPAFKNLRPDADTDWIGEGAAETLTTKLTGVPGLVAVERTQIKKLMEERKLSVADLLDGKNAAMLGRLLGADRVVTGSYVLRGDGILFNVRVVDVRTAAVLNAASVVGSEDKIFDALFRVAEVVIESFDRKVVMVDARPVIRPAPRDEHIVLTAAQRRMLRERGTTNPGAYRAFSRALAAADVDEKIRLYTEAIRLDPRYAWAYNNRGIAYRKKGDYGRAIRDYDRAIALKPDYAVAYNNRGNAYHDKGDYDRAIRDYDRAIALKPDLAEAYYNRGNAYHDKGDYDRAIRDYDRAIALKPDYAEAYNNRGIAYRKKGDYVRAIRDYDRAIALKPDDAEAYNNRGVAYWKKGEYDRAIHDFDRALALKPDLAEAYNNRGLAYDDKGEHDRAIQDFDRAIALKPDYAKAYNNRGLAYGKKGEYDRAIRDYDRAIALKPDYAKAYYNRGLAYGKKGEYDRAIRDYDRAIALKPDYAKAYYNRAVAHYGRRDYDRAWADVKMCRKLGGKVHPSLLRALTRASGRTE